MMNKPQLFDEQGVLHPFWRKKVQLLTCLYALAVAVMCFMPQPQLLDGVSTPNILYWGRLRLLLVPFNSLLGLGQVDSWLELLWIFTQNLLNVFLLYPLILGFLALRPVLRKPRQALFLAFSCSLFIELTQLLLDVLVDANRVFEIDDLWTNTLGGYLAYVTLVYLLRKSIQEIKSVV